MNSLDIYDIIQYLIPSSIFSRSTIIVSVLLFLWLCFVRIVPLIIKMTVEMRELQKLNSDDLFASIPYTKEKHEQLISSSNIKRNTRVFKIFNLIAISGINESRLDVPEVINSVEEYYDRQMDSIKITISSFIILGLLGTFFGLAESFAPLSNIVGKSHNISIENNIKDLLEKLKSAFAPSIWGVFLSLIGLFIYNSILSNKCNKFVLMLKEAVIGVWIPALYPTSPQKWANILENSAKVLNAVLLEIKEKSTESYSEFSKNVKETSDNITKLIGILSSTIDRTSTFRKMMDQIVKSSDSLSKTSLNIKSFYEDVKTNTDLLKEHLTSLSGEWSKQLDLIEQQHQSLKQLIEQEASKADSFIERVVSNFDNTNSLISELKVSLPERLELIGREIARLRNPLEKSAEDIRQYFGNFYIYIENKLGPYINDLVNKVDTRNEIKEFRESVDTAYVEFIGSYRDSMSQILEAMAAIKNIDEMIAIREAVKSNSESVNYLTGSFNKSVNDILSTIRSVDSRGEISELTRTIYAYFNNIASLMDEIKSTITMSSSKDNVKAIESSVQESSQAIKNYQEILNKIEANVQNVNETFKAAGLKDAIKALELSVDRNLKEITNYEGLLKKIIENQEDTNEAIKSADLKDKIQEFKISMEDSLKTIKNYEEILNKLLTSQQNIDDSIKSASSRDSIQAIEVSVGNNLKTIQNYQELLNKIVVHQQDIANKIQAVSNLFQGIQKDVEEHPPKTLFRRLLGR